MPSPFPGMNPYIEQRFDWPDFHVNFITRMQEALVRQVGDQYFVKAEERLILHERSAEERTGFGRADTGVIKSPGRRRVKSAATTLAVPLRLRLPAIDVEKHRFLEIRTIDDLRLVTVVEVLSPSNKTRGPDHDVYVAKRRQILRSQAHLVEIDLRRGGQRPPSPELPACDYYVLVSRWEERPDVDVWPIGLRQPLPTVPVPLLKPDPDVTLDLKAVLDQTYDALALGNRIYLHTPEPPLAPADAAWARRLVPKRRR